MGVAQKVAGTSDLATLQTIVGQAEAGDGPLDEIAILSEAGQNFSLLTFDDGADPNLPVMSRLALSTDPIPAGQALFLRGPAFIGSQQQTLCSYIPSDEGSLAKRIVSFFLSRGWSKVAGIGIVANIKAESAYDPRRLGDAGTAFGLCQWRGQRQTDFQTSFHKAIQDSTFREQLEFIDQELSGTEKIAGTALKAATTVTDAAIVICEKYERPHNPAVDSATRAATATNLLARFFS